MMLTVEMLREARRLLDAQSPPPDGPLWVHIPGYGALNVNEKLPDNEKVRDFFNRLFSMT